jgi:hypothetical protein
MLLLTVYADADAAAELICSWLLDHMFSGLPPYQFPLCKLCTAFSVSGYINRRWRHPQRSQQNCQNMWFWFGQTKALDSSFLRKQGNISWQPMMCFWRVVLASMPCTYLLHNLFKKNYRGFILVRMKKIQ